MSISGYECKTITTVSFKELIEEKDVFRDIYPSTASCLREVYCFITDGTEGFYLISKTTGTAVMILYDIHGGYLLVFRRNMEGYRL